MESQGQELCHEYFVESGICDPKHCADRCTDKWKDLASVLMEPKSAAALSNVKLSLYLLFMLS